MDISKIIGIVVTVLKVFAAKTETIIDDKVLSLLEAVQNSPAVLQWIEDLSKSDIPDGALHITAVPPELVGVVSDAPEGAEGLGGLLSWVSLLKYLPALIEIIKQIRAANPS